MLAIAHRATVKIISSLQNHRNLSYSHCERLTVICAFRSPTVQTDNHKEMRHCIKLVLFERWIQFKDLWMPVHAYRCRGD